MLDNDQIQAKCCSFISHAESSQDINDKRQRALLNEDYYRGVHWQKDEWDKFMASGVKPHTINRCLSTIKGICGVQQQNSQEVAVFPRKGGNSAVAEVWTEILKHAQDMAAPDDEGAEYLYSELFERGCIDCESFLIIAHDENQNAGGQPVFYVKGPLDVEVDPACTTYNLNGRFVNGTLRGGAKYIIEKEWVDKEELETRYPEHGELIGSNLATHPEDKTGVITYLLGPDDITEDPDSKRFQFRIRFIWWKERIPAIHVVDKQTQKVAKVKDQEKVAKLKGKESKRFDLLNRSTHILHRSVMLGKFLLEDTTNPYGDELIDYPIFRFAPHFDQGYSFGILDNIIDLNREENVNRTLVTKYLQQTINSAWKVGGGSPKKKQELADFGAVDGLVIDESEYGRKVEKIEPHRINEGRLINAEQFEQDAKRVSGIDDAMLGYDTGKAESGRAIYLKQIQGRITSETVFKNFYRTLSCCGNYQLKFIEKTKCYTDDEVRAIVAESTLLTGKYVAKAEQELFQMIGARIPQPMPPQAPNPELLAGIAPEDKHMVYQNIKAGAQAAVAYAEQYPYLLEQWDEIIKEHAIEYLLAELKDADLAEYGVRVSLSPFAPTVRMANFAELCEIQDKYGIIPPDILIEAADLPNKEQILAKIKSVQAQPAQPAPVPAGAA